MAYSRLENDLLKISSIHLNPHVESYSFLPLEETALLCAMLNHYHNLDAIVAEQEKEKEPIFRKTFLEYIPSFLYENYMLEHEKSMRRIVSELEHLIHFTIGYGMQCYKNNENMMHGGWGNYENYYHIDQFGYDKFIMLASLFEKIAKRALPEKHNTNRNTI